MQDTSSLKYKIKVAYLPSYLLHNLTVSPRQAEKSNRSPFFLKLEESIKTNGIINPILVEAGRVRQNHRQHMTEYHTDNERTLFFVTQLGGSRTWVAQKLGISVLCVISDFQDLVDGPEVSKEYAESLFRDLPEGKGLSHNKWGLTGPTLKHRHLNNK